MNTARDVIAEAYKDELGGIDDEMGSDNNDLDKIEEKVEEEAEADAEEANI